MRCHADIVPLLSAAGGCRGGNGPGGGLAFAKLLAVALIGIKPFDPVAFASTAGLMALVAALATWVPARRAARVDPMVALRCE